MPKILTISNAKGGTGKSAVSVQLAYYAALKRGLSVALIDLDSQGNSSKALSKAERHEIPASSLMTDDHPEIAISQFQAFAADSVALRSLERQDDKHSQFATNLKRNTQRICSDLVIIDTSPAPDIRQLSALVVATHVISPVVMAVESIDGIAALLKDPEIGIRRIQATVNPELVFLGLLPNSVQPTPFQRDNFKALATEYSDLLLRTGSGGFAAIKQSTAIFEAQAAGLPVWEIKKQSARDCMVVLTPVFDAVLSQMGLTEPEQ